MIASAGWHRAEQYIKAVQSGDIVACETLKGVIARHQADLQREATKEFPFYFDYESASTVIDFFGLVLKHSIGEYAGRGFELEPWQAFGVGMLFGWKRCEDTTRRFRKLYWSMGRKNGKSCLAAGLALFMAGFDVNPATHSPEQVAEVVLAATKREQSEKVIYAEIERMRLQSPAIKKRCKTTNRQVTFHHNFGSIRCVGSDKPYDGLNPHCVFIDEMHAMSEHHRPFYETMITGSGARLQPLNVITTTAGDDRSYLWLEEYKYVSAVAKGEITDHQLLPIIYELDDGDDPLDESLWLKSNPNLGVSVKLDYLRSQAAKAKTGPKALQVLTRYHGNRVVSATQRAFDVDAWDKCKGDLSDWSEAEGIGAGIDLGGRDDLAAFSLVARFPIEGQFTQPKDPDTEPEPVWRYEVMTWAFIAEDTARDLKQEPFATWIYEEKIKLCKFPINALKQELIAQCEAYGVNSIAYDPAGGQDMAETVSLEGFEIASMGQNCRHFNEPISDFQQAIQDGRLRHNGCELLRWCVGNAVTIQDRQMRVMFDKRNSNEKIDPVVAAVMAYRRAMCAPRRVEGPIYLCE